METSTRNWVAPNGHKVTVTWDANITSRSTHNGRSDYYSRTSYKCECGKQMAYSRSPLKAHMDDHDRIWFDPTTPEFIERQKRIAEALGVAV
jgi:hypothetical protein